MHFPRSHFALLLMVLALGCGEGSPAPTESAPATLTPDQYAAAKNRATALMGQFKYAEAVETLRPVVDSSHASAEDRIDLAIALLNRRAEGDLEASAALLEAVIAAEPKNLRALYCRGLLQLHAGGTAEALKLLQQVTTQDPADGYAAYYHGQCLLTLGKPAEAARQYQRAREADPYLRSAFYGEFQALQRTGAREAAQAALATFQKLEGNPRARLIDLKYTRMGPKAEVGASTGSAEVRAKPQGPIFTEQALLSLDGAAAVAWGPGPATITSGDFDGDGKLDLFLAGATSSGGCVLLHNAGEKYEPIEAPFTSVKEVQAACWGDYDDDGLVDLYLCRAGANQLWRQIERGNWADVTAETQTAGSGGKTIDGLCYDFDHDGDLDYLLVKEAGPREVLSNDRTGAFRSIAGELEIAGAGAGSRQAVVADLDADDDADLLSLNPQPPQEVYLNDRLWRYHPAPGCEALAASDLRAAVALDADVDGQPELYTAGPQGVQRWTRSSADQWISIMLAAEAATELACYDFDGDTQCELLVRNAGQWRLLDAASGKVLEEHPCAETVGQLAVIVSDNGPEVVASTANGAPVIWRAGAGRHPFALVQFAGRTDRGAEMRSNASGLGVQGVARIGDRWTPLPASRQSSTPGNSLAPHAIGLAGREKIDFVRLLWPDGVSQTELDLAPGTLHMLTETQRQAGSCPLLFVGVGKQFEFVADLLGAGGLGFNVGRGEYYPPRAEENFLLPTGLLKPHADKFVLKLGEPMEEVCYFDAVRLVAYDLPPGWSMTLDERFGGLDPQPTGAPCYYRQQLFATRAVNDRGADITTELREADGEPAPLARRDRRFIGLTEPHTVTLEFAEPLDQLANPVLKYAGWVEYAYSQSAFAAWQAGVAFHEPTIEAQDAAGQWQVVAERFGYPAGTSREGSVPLAKPNLPPGARRLRITTNLHLYWDQLAVVDSDSPADVQRQAAPLVGASVSDVGFAERSLLAHRRAVFDYQTRPPFGDSRHPAGYYTEFGPATDLVAARDDALAIIGPGEELHLEFTPPKQPCPSGFTRRWVVEADGWCKDADLFTANAGEVEPLPRRLPAEESPEADRQKLHRKYNTRFRSGY